MNHKLIFSVLATLASAYAVTNNGVENNINRGSGERVSFWSGLETLEVSNRRGGQNIASLSSGLNVSPDGQDACSAFRSLEWLAYSLIEPTEDFTAEAGTRVFTSARRQGGPVVVSQLAHRVMRGKY